MGIIQSPGPGPFPTRYFNYAGGKDDHVPARNLVRSGYANKARNGGFEAWAVAAATTDTAPDGWSWEGSGGGSVVKNSSPFRGLYCAAVTMYNYGGANRLVQDFWNLAGSNLAQNGLWTVSARVYSGEAKKVRLVAYDGTNYFYGPWFQETAVWERQWFTVKLSSSATAFKAGFQFEQTSGMSAIFKADEFMLCRGATPQFYQEHPNDRSLICQDWDNDGTLVPARGIVRAIPYQASGRCTGGSGVETVTVSLTYGCKKIVHVDANLYSWSGIIPLTETRTTNYTQTSFDIKFNYYGTISSTWNYMVTGVVYAIGWDDLSEQWK